MSLQSNGPGIVFPCKCCSKPNIECPTCVPLDLVFMFDKASVRHQGNIISTAEATAARCMVQDAETQLTQFDDAIVRLVQSRSQLSSYLAYNKAKTAPIRKLPLELLHNIFTFLCMSSAANLLEGSLPALTLTHVCGGWRDWVRDASCLWADVSLISTGRGTFRDPPSWKGLPNSTPPSRPIYVLLELYLANSAHALLHITLSLNHFDAQQEACLTLLCKHSERCSTLLMDAKDSERFPVALINNMDKLSFLEISGPQHPPPHRPLPFERSRELKTVLMQNQTLRFAHFPMVQLTRLTFTLSTLEDIRCLQTHGQQLEFLTIRIDQLDDLDNFNTHVPSAECLPNLTELVISGEDASVILASFWCPKLVTLDLKKSHLRQLHRPPDEESSILDFLQRPAKLYGHDLTRLTQLSLTGVSMWQDQLEELVLRRPEVLAGLKTLTLDGFWSYADKYASAENIAPTLLCSLLLDDSRSGVLPLPSLEHIVVNSKATRIDERLLERFVATRAKAASLKTMRISFPGHKLSSQLCLEPVVDGVKILLDFKNFQVYLVEGGWKNVEKTHFWKQTHWREIIA